MLKKYYIIFLKKFHNNLNRLKKTEHLFMMLAAAFIGLLGGFGAVGIKKLINYISEISFSGSGNLITNITQTPWFLVILIPAIGGLIVGPLIYFFAPEAKGSGVPEVMGSVIKKNGKIRGRVAIIKALASSITIGTGGSVGKEGPIVHIGSSLGSKIGQLLKVPASRLKVLVGCGAAAGIAGAFNAPVAGALFAIEIILMDFAVNSFSPIVISSVIATVVSHSFDGDFASFNVADFQFVSSWEVLFYIILGGLTGVISFLFIKSIYFFENIWENKINIKPYFKPAFGGLIVGAIALLFPEIMGVGYDSIDAAINGKDLVYNGHGFNILPEISTGLLSQSVFYMSFILIFVKIFSTSMTLSSGGSGGVFAPSLFIGAMLGAFFGYIIHYFFPQITPGHTAYALVAMGGLVAGTTRAPITAILIVFELTKENAIILPLMLTCIGSVVISTKLSRESIYTIKLLQKKINVKERPEINILNTISVGDVFTNNYDWVFENEKFDIVVKKLLNSHLPFLSVISMDGKFLGMISLNDIKEFIFDSETTEYLIAGDLTNPNIPKIKLEDNCKQAFEYLNTHNLECLPVIGTENTEKQIGIVWRKDIDLAYHKELEKIDISSDLATRIMMSNTEKDVSFMEGYAISEIPAPKEFVGKSLKELQVRNTYGIDVLSIKQKNPNQNVFTTETVKAIPDSNHIFNEFDILIIAGEKENINKIKQII